MRTIGIRQFQQHFHQELKNIPFVVTQNGVAYFSVLPFDRKLTEKELDKSKTLADGNSDTQNFQCEIAGCKNFDAILCRILWSDEIGEHNMEMKLCSVHVKAVEQGGSKVQKL